MTPTEELISIREAARRLGVSDVAVHKAIKTGRVIVADRTEKGWPLLAWPAARDQWRRNTDEGQQRKPVAGSIPLAPARPKPAPPAAPAAAIEPAPPAAVAAPDPEPAVTPAARTQPAARAPEESAGQTAVANAPSFAQSRAIREAYQARLAKLDFEERSGRLVGVDQVKADAFKTARQVRDALLNIPDRVAMELAHETDPARVHEKLATEIRVALEAIAGAAA